MQLTQSTISMLTVIPHGAIIIDLQDQVIVEQNSCFLKTFGIKAGSNIYQLRKIFVQTPLLMDVDKAIMLELKQGNTSMWPNFAIYTLENGISNFDLHIKYLDESRTAVVLIFCPSAHDIKQLELHNGYYETISASSFSYPFYLNLKTKRMEFFGPIMEQFKLPEVMDDFPKPVLDGGMILEEDLPKYMEMVDRMYKGEPPAGHFRSYTPNGDILGYSVNYTIKYDDDGEPSELIGDFINKQEEALNDEKELKNAATDESDNKNKLLVHQIKAHFFFNTLNTISALCKQDAAKADKAIQTFAAYMRSYMYLITEEHNIPFRQELSMVRSSLEIERMRFPDSFTYTLDLQCKDFEVPPLTLQPIVENALLHGLRKTGHHGQLLIKTEKIDNIVQITVEDDGRGFDTSLLKESKSIGIKNMIERIKLMANGTVTITSEIGKGTRAVIKLPIQDV